MYVTNLTTIPLKYYTKGIKIVLEPGIATLVDENIVSAKKLKDCYGTDIDIINQVNLEKQYANYSGNAKPVAPIIEEELRDKLLELLENGDFDEEKEGTEDDAEEGTEEIENTEEGTEEIENTEPTESKTPEITEKDTKVVKEAKKVTSKATSKRNRGSKKSK